MLKKIHDGRFLSYYTNDTGYEFASRKKVPFIEGNKKPDAVVIVAFNVDEDAIILVQELRPPVGEHVLSFPAGLIDEGETAEEAAVREFKEETGLDLIDAEIIHSGAFTSPGMTDEQNAIVLGSFSGELKAEEGSKVLKVDVHELADICEQDNTNVTAKLATFVAGIGVALMAVERHIRME